MQLVSGPYSLELSIAGYQFPDAVNGEESEPLGPDDSPSEWLMIEGKVQHPKGNWQFRDPSLMTAEVAELADWLEHVPTHEELEPCRFIEPVISFEKTDEEVRVHFAGEARPAWAGPNFYDSAVAIFQIADIDWLAAAKSLRIEVAKFPARSNT